jgi:hypothetical protein
MNFSIFFLLLSSAIAHTTFDVNLEDLNYTTTPPSDINAELKRQPHQDFANIKIYDSIEEFNANLPEMVTLLKAPNQCNVYLVGTVHYSEKSKEDVANVIRNVRPKNVVLEVS